MIPVRLEIEGLYSYRERQTVEFESLTAAGLFGIFGAVGSGKSSILEGILLALYGSTERLSATGERSSMVNLQSNQLIVNFTFRAGRNNAKTYLARYTSKRNKKDFDKIDTGEHVFYEWRDGNWEAMAEKAEAVLGMSKEHFKQTIIIPQGKFREFIDQKPIDRAEMMQQLFGLDRFDLSAKTGALLKNTREGKIRLETQLTGLEHISQELIEEKTAQAQRLDEKNQQNQQAKIEAETSYYRLESIRKAYVQLKENKDKLAKLETQKEEIEKKRTLHREFIKAKTYLRPVWERLKDTEKDLEKYKVSVSNCNDFKVIYEKEVLQLEEEEKDLRRKNEERPAREAKIRDLRKVIELQELDAKLDASSKEIDQLKPKIDAQKTAQKTLETEIESLDATLESLPQTEVQHLAELKTALSEATSWKDRLTELHRIKENFEKEIIHLNETLTQILQEIPSEENSLESWAKSKKSQISELEHEREKILRKQGLKSHTHLLTNGEPCPLCGSSEHPNPLIAGEEEARVKVKEMEIQKEKEVLEHILSLTQKKNLGEANLENLKRNLLDKNREISGLENQVQEHSRRLVAWNIKNETELTGVIEEFSKALQKKESLQKLIQKQRKLWQSQREILEKEEQQYQKALLNKQDVLSRISEKKKEIKDPDFSQPYFQKDLETIRKAISKVERDIEEASKDLVGKQKHLTEKRDSQTRNLADLENFKSLVRENEQRLLTYKEQFAQLKLEHGFLDEEALIRLFHHSLDAEKTDLEIRHFDQNLATTLSRISELQQEEGVLGFTEVNFLEAKALLEEIQKQAKEVQEQLVLVQEAIKQVSSHLEEKKRLTKIFLEVEARETHLRELERLFQGKGFVKYVSSIYLRELCNTANQRFMKLTKNSLSLEIDDNNTFWVIDYLNGGKKRLLKTLSGGQTFQASLCLALALAEKVKALNQADQSFFFLDEGFGALDRSSLRIVFETLKALRHENRVVGIISHVEELQQEIGVFAQIELDPEKGSQIRYSY
jgi:DNA repair protein SbcC/Rad50